MKDGDAAHLSSPAGPGPLGLPQRQARSEKTWHAYPRLSDLAFSDPGAPSGGAPLPLKTGARGYPYVSSMPEIRRLSITPVRIDRRPLPGWLRRLKTGAKKSLGPDSARTAAGTRDNGWRHAARRRRIVLLALVLAQTALGSWSMAKIFPYPWLNSLEIAILVTSAVLFSWLSFGFWTAVAGWWMRWRGSKWLTIMDSPSDADDRRALTSRTAALIPICNEDVDRVFAGLEAMHQSLAATGQLGHFDFYVLSDTDRPEKQVQEEIAWSRVCRKVHGFGRIFYRHRRNNIKRKSGNIADFLRRWGCNYDYMIVLDADSVMAGNTLTRLVRMMHRHPKAGIIQTLTTTVNHDSLFARMQQFSSRVYGPMFAAGLHFWQLGENSYWGHNAIIRVEAFVKQCGLTRLPGKAPLGGEILSHDFVEAALMGRGGWEVWLALGLDGSYEETPPTLLDELKRDRRWCQGNMQHMRLLFGDGFRAGHRALFSMGIMAYGSALLWAIFLVLMTVQMAVESVFPPNYFPPGPSLFPLWPQWRPEWAIALLSTTAVLLFLPKFLAWTLILKSRQSGRFGGVIPLTASIFLEIVVSTFLAPTRMWFHSKFVLLTLMGRQIQWGAQSRKDKETVWPQAARFHGVSTLIGMLWLLAAFHTNSSFALWVLPVAGSILVSVPLSVLSSKASLGRALRRCRLFLIPEEIAPPEILQRLRVAFDQSAAARSGRDGFVAATVDRHALAVHLGLLRGKTTRSAAAASRNRDLREKALTHGPASLTAHERAMLLKDVESMATLHIDLAQLDDPSLADRWGIGKAH